MVVAAERGIPSDLVDDCLGFPDSTENRADGTLHYCKRFDRMAGRWLHKKLVRMANLVV